MWRWRMMLVVALLAAGCGDSDDDAAPTAASPTPPAEATATLSEATPAPTATAVGELDSVVYLLRDGAVAPVARRVEQTEGVAGAAVSTLMAGETEEERGAGLRSAIAQGTRLRSIDLRDGLATVDLSQNPGNALARAQIVHTLTRFPSIARVSIQVNGDDLAGPVDRADFEEQSPAILVESPLPGETVSSPLSVSGTSNTFEATSQLELLGPDGEELDAQVVTATSGSGTRGTWKATVRFDVSAGSALELYTYESSAESGEPVNEVRVPLVAG